MHFPLYFLLLLLLVVCYCSHAAWCFCFLQLLLSCLQFNLSSTSMHIMIVDCFIWENEQLFSIITWVRTSVSFQKLTTTAKAKKKSRILWVFSLYCWFSDFFFCLSSYFRYFNVLQIIWRIISTFRINNHFYFVRLEHGHCKWHRIYAFFYWN